MSIENTFNHSFPKNTPNWQMLLVDAVQKPGRISAAYSAFHNYSIGNALEALWQCTVRGIEPGPINTYIGWQQLGRHVRKGEKAISLWMPVTCKGKRRDPETDEDIDFTFTRFIYKPHWFVLSQTEGKELEYPQIPGFDLESALAGLKISRIPFDLTDGNCQGFAREHSIAVNPVAALPLKTSFHEAAHVLLGHTETSPFSDYDTPPRNIREVEAEAVALIGCESLGSPGADYSRGYIQHYLRGNEIPEKSAQRIFSAAAQILKAGQQCSADLEVAA